MKVRDFLNRKNWCKGVLALDANGLAVPPRDSSAVRFCLLGAVERCYPENRGKIIMTLLSHVPENLSRFNDTAIWEQIEALLEKADV